MSASRVILVLFGVMIVGALGLGGCAYSGYRGTITKDENVKKNWADVEVQLERRFSLIPNLVATTKGYAGHEKEVFTKIAEARNAYASAATQNEKVQAASVLDGMLRTVLVQPFPELKANENFRSLQVTLEGTENRLAEARRNYNDAVADLNTAIRGFPGSMYASWSGVKVAEPFKADEGTKIAPKVEF